MAQEELRAHLEEDALQSAVEAVLFAAGEPVGVERLCMTLGLDRSTVDELCHQLADQYSYERRGLRVIRLENAWQMVSAPEYASLIRQTFESRRPAKLSQPALEVLSIIAYFQPTTRAYVDQVRGVDSSYTVGLLLEREMIEEAGRLAVAGRPILYRTTQNFLRSFGLASLDELPELPASSLEDSQMTLEIQANIEKLRAVQENMEAISDDELLAAAQRLAAQELSNTPGEQLRLTSLEDAVSPSAQEGEPASPLSEEDPSSPESEPEEENAVAFSSGDEEEELV